MYDLWRVNALPPPVDDRKGLGDTTGPAPLGGLVVRLAVFPPNSEVDWELASTEPPYSQTPAGGADVAGMHATDTVDVVTVISGELRAVLDTIETVLHPGDTLIQRSTRHAWRNDGDVPATVVTIMMSTPPSGA